jgi:aminopeptidase-like protein
MGDEGISAFDLASRLWPLNRSLTGDGNRKTLTLIQQEIANLEILEVPSGLEVFDWTTPPEWNVESAWIEDPNGRVFCDFSSNNLHLVGYSIPFKGRLTWEELEPHLYSLPDQPKAIPYVTSYYEATWGFCVDHETLEQLPRRGLYTVVINSTLEPGHLSMGELVVPGASSREIFFSTYICHPSMANNELSGPALAVELAKFIQLESRHYTYRIIFIPETIGSLTYLSMNRASFREKMVAGYVLTCVGDERAYSLMPSPSGQTPADVLARKAFDEMGIAYTEYSWPERGSDERQYCSPGVELPVASAMRSKYGQFSEYHTSEDALGSVVTHEGLQGSFDVYRKIIDLCEDVRYPKSTILGEPMLSKRALYPTISKKRAAHPASDILNVFSYCDGKTEVRDISRKLGLDAERVKDILQLLESHKLIIW